MGHEHPTITVQFRVAYMTVWGQHLVVIGATSELGSWDVSRAPSLNCRHAGEELIWEGQLVIPWHQELQYKYGVVNDKGVVDVTETEPRTVQVPHGLPDAAVVQFFDDWQVRPVILSSDPVRSLHRSARLLASLLRA